MLRYTICFIRRGDQVLLLNRQHPPLVGLWNGVGGKIKPGESALAGVLREVAEETGIALPSARFTGVVTWGFDGEAESGGMYAFVAAVPEGLVCATPAGTPEGVLDWKALDWVFDPQNQGVVSNIQRFLPPMLAAEPCLHHHFDYVGRQIVGYRARPLERVEYPAPAS